MIDRREQILNYLATQLLPSVQGIVAVSRDRGDLIPREDTPGIILLDGSETKISELANDRRGYAQRQPPTVMRAEPQIIVALTPRDDQTNTTLNGQSAPVGPELSLYRVRVINAVLNDDTLMAICGDNGKVEYFGFETDMQVGSTLGTYGAAIQLRFAFQYVLNPAELT